VHNLLGSLYTAAVAREEDTARAIDVLSAAAEPTVAAPSTGAPVAPLPAMVGGKYRPVRLIAKGGMGAVYEVIHTNTGEHLALKLMLARSLLAPDLVERFRREARIHSFVKSEHVVRVIDADVARELDDAPFLVMELLDGLDFERICLERRPSRGEVVEWMRQLAPALDKAHQEGIVHRDLKPENVFLAQRPGLPSIVKVLDFGVAKMASETDGQATATGQILGTPRYMAPEQAIDAKQISAAADRFALGLITFRLLCGRHYFTGDNWVRLLREVARGPQERPSTMGGDLGPAFDAWFARACASEPGDRFATCVEQVEALAGALEGRAVPASGWRRARLWLVAAAAAVVLAASAWGVSRRTAARVPAAIVPPRPIAAAQAPPAAILPPAPSPTPPLAAPPAASVKPTAAAPSPARRKGGRAAPRPSDGEAKPAPSSPAAPSPPASKPAPDRIWDEP
jgi:serine/threonine-protein kinase